MKKQRKATHGGGRVLTGVYMTIEETERYEEACKAKGVSKSGQGVKLLNSWADRTLKNSKKVSK